MGKNQGQGQRARAPALHKLGGEAAPVGDLSQAFATGVLEESYFVAGMFEFVDVGPDLSLPGSLVGRGFSATGAAVHRCDLGSQFRWL